MPLATGSVRYWTVLCSGVADAQTLLPSSLWYVLVSVIYAVVCTYNDNKYSWPQTTAKDGHI